MSGRELKTFLNIFKLSQLTEILNINRIISKLIRTCKPKSDDIRPSGLRLPNKHTQTRKIHTWAEHVLFAPLCVPFPLAPTYLFSCYFKHSHANVTLCTSHRMPLALHINWIKSSVSEQACIHFFTFHYQAGSSISTSLSCSPLRQPCWRLTSSKLAQLTKYGKPKRINTPIQF